MSDIHAQLKRLEAWFASIDHAMIALSGGVDSSVVTYLSRRFLGREGTLAVISNSASLKQRDLETARQFCDEHDIPLLEIDAREIDDPNYASNPVNRCYFCKTALYTSLQRLRTERYPGYRILNGNNFSDFGDYRPGLEAADEHRVRSPLADCGFSKADIRAMARHFQLSTWDKPASPCLSSRFPYGHHITVEKLRQVEAGEEVLAAYGFDNMRLRHYGDTARIEVPADQVARLQQHFDAISARIRDLGFERCEIDDEGLISGKLNRALPSLSDE